MLDKSAIELIQETAVDANSDRLAARTINAVALPDNYKIHPLERYGAGRDRFRGTMATSDLSDFVHYVKRNVGGEGFVDANEMSATVYFNLGDKELPGHADWRSVLKLEQTAAYKALLALNGSRKVQRSLIEVIEDWNAHMRPVMIGDEGSTEPYGSIAKAVSAIRQITIKTTSEKETTQGNFNSRATAMDEVEARSRLELPAGFEFRCVPYHGLTERTYLLRLSILTASEDPQLVLRVMQLEAHQEAVAQEFKSTLIHHIGNAATITIGTFTP